MAANKRGFLPTGPTVALSLTATAATAVQVSNTTPTMLDRGVQARIFNSGPNIAFISLGPDATTAQNNAVIPVGGTPANAIPIPVGAVEVLTTGTNQFWSGICAATNTATLYVTPGDGL